MDLDLVNDNKKKLAKFRVKELKDVLSMLGLEKHGLKRDLVARISDLLNSEQGSSTSVPTEVAQTDKVANVIDVVHRKMRAESYESELDRQSSDDYVPGVTNSIMENMGCPCGFLLPDSMTDLVQCENSDCLLLQHKTCVLRGQPVPPHFYCECCRINQANPFWVVRRDFVTMMNHCSENGVDGENSDVKLHAQIKLRSEDIYLTELKGYEIQVGSIILNDVVQFRMHWPKSSELKINGVAVKTVDRSGDQMLGPNGGDDGALISRYLQEGWNQISFSAKENRDFCLVVRLVKPRTIQEIHNIISNEHQGEPLNDAMMRVIRSVRVGAQTNEDVDVDGDLEVLGDVARVDLRCPISGARMKTASRFRSCIHMGCFDLESFLELAHATRKWQCPICLKNYSWKDTVIDPYFNQVIRTIEQSGAHTTDIMIKRDGSWFTNNGANTSGVISSGTINYGASFEDPMIISDSE